MRGLWHFLSYTVPMGVIPILLLLLGVALGRHSSALSLIVSIIGWWFLFNRLGDIFLWWRLRKLRGIMEQEEQHPTNKES